MSTKEEYFSKNVQGTYVPLTLNQCVMLCGQFKYKIYNSQFLQLYSLTNIGRKCSKSNAFQISVSNNVQYKKLHT